eukprot:COSAG06_NODE_2049_length_7740_cov_9.497579_7_plen_320_part_00
MESRPPDQMQASLTANTSNPLSPVVQPAGPTFRHLEDRAVSAAFLKKFAAEKVTREIERRATKAAVRYLKAQIGRRQQDVKELVATQKTAAVEDSAGGGKRHAINLTNANRWLGWLQEDLAKRKAKPYVTARDVHRYIIKPETEEHQCRYCDLPGLAEEKDPETGMYYFGLAQHFFSYNWDSPFEDVVDAICTHSEAEVAEGKPPPYYWVDNFAINQLGDTSPAWYSTELWVFVRHGDLLARVSADGPYDIWTSRRREAPQTHGKGWLALPPTRRACHGAAVFRSSENGCRVAAGLLSSLCNSGNRWVCVGFAPVRPAR